MKKFIALALLLALLSCAPTQIQPPDAAKLVAEIATKKAEVKIYIHCSSCDHLYTFTGIGGGDIKFAMTDEFSFQEMPRQARNILSKNSQKEEFSLILIYREGHAVALGYGEAGPTIPDYKPGWNEKEALNFFQSELPRMERWVLP